ncbi:MAG: ABC transporter ATP-binding protein [Thermoplasmataceae archaeon]
MARSYEEEEEDVLKSQKGGRVFRRLLGEIFSQKRDSRILIISVIITALAGTLYPLALGEAINGVISRNTGDLFIFGAAFLGFFITQFFSNRMRTISSTKVAQQTIKNLRDRSFSNIQKVPVSFFGKVKTGYLISRITNDAESLSEFLTFQIPQVVSGISTVIVSITIMFYLNFTLTLYALIVIPLLSGFTFSIQKKVRRYYLRTRKTIAAITGNLAENISGIRAIKSFNVEDRMATRFDGLNNDNFDSNIKAAKLSSVYGAIIRVIEAAGIAIVLIVGAQQLFANVISVGILVTFVVYVQEFFDPVTQLSQLYNSYQSSMVGLTRIYGIIDSPPADSSNEGKTLIEGFKGSIKLDDVSFAYGDSVALKNVDIEIMKGKKVGIVGHTGAGKTTFSNILLKFFAPTSGKVTIDGVDLKEIDTNVYRKLISPVLQEPFMFRGTILDNVKAFMPEATDEYIIGKAKEFGLYALFENLENGFNSDIGEMGRNLSEGQRQAISILRAFIRNPEILIMDEPTSQIDPYSEKLIISSLDSFLKDKTLILITHRFSMISLVERVISFQEGEKVEDGTFSELLKSDGVFRKMYNIQFNTDYQ